MLLYLPETKMLIATQEGTGDNLLAEDIDEGLKDYWLSSIYQLDGEEITLKDSSQIMTSRLISEMSLDEQLRIIKEYWEVHTQEHILIEGGD